jgi:predicted nucleotidyltransferase component of viral defense system
MIPENAITEWRNNVPWNNPEQVEQDLLICRSLVEIFKDTYLSSRLAFRGGTALHKLYVKPQARYSEDIDLVQIKAEPIKKTLDALRNALAFLGEPIIKQKKNNNTLVFKVDSEVMPIVPLHIKIEINCKEHFSVFGWSKLEFNVINQWYKGKCSVNTYLLEELLGTKLRALYQRKKGRDLFDIYKVCKSQDIDMDKVIHCYTSYMKFSVDTLPTKRQFIRNMEDKMKDPAFLGDITFLLRPNEFFDFKEAYLFVKDQLIEKL